MIEKKNPILLSGWLNKKKSVSRLYKPNWNRRWMSIENDMLCWRHSESKKNFNCLKLNDIHKVYAVGKLRSGKKVNMFVVKASRRIICLMAKNKHDCMRWVRAIQMQLDLSLGGTSSGPKSVKNSKRTKYSGDKFEKMMKSVEKNQAELSNLSIGSNNKNYNHNHIVEIQEKKDDHIIYFNQQDMDDMLELEKIHYQLQ